MSQRFEGRNLEEALAAAAASFGVERVELHYHVVAEKRGFLGGVKHVVIEADRNEEAIAPAAPAPVTAPRDSSRQAPREASRGGRNRGRGGPARGRSPRGADRGRGPRDQPDDFDDSPAPEQGAESAAALTVHEWVSELIQQSGFRLDARTVENETEIWVRFYGRDARRLTDQHGELLDAMQVLANKALVGRTVEKPVEFDAGGFKKGRQDEIGEQARVAAERVRREGREQLLPAMSPVERRIVHLALRDDEAVTTESRGEGFYKRVAIILRPDPPAPPAGS